VAQEAVARVLAARARGVAIRDERAYGLQIAARLAITRLRARANGRALEATGVDAGRAPATPIEAPPEVARLYAAIRALPARQAAVVTLRKLCELEYAEVAVLLGISQESCRSHCRRAMERLRAVLAKPEEPRGR